jgi:hypothetical protein
MVEEAAEHHSGMSQSDRISFDAETERLIRAHEEMEEQNHHHMEHPEDEEEMHPEDEEEMHPEDEEEMHHYETPLYQQEHEHHEEVHPTYLPLAQRGMDDYHPMIDEEHVY